VRLRLFLSSLRLPPNKANLLSKRYATRKARAISHRFAEAVQEIFLTADNPIGKLTIRYGVF